MKDFSVLSFLPTREGKPSYNIHSILRGSDSSVFCIGDFVTDETPIKDCIDCFELIDNKILAVTTRGVQIALASLKKIETLPAQHQVNENVLFSINQGREKDKNISMHILKAQIKAVHFYAGKVKYDLEIPIEDEPPTRVYNIDSCFVLHQN